MADWNSWWSKQGSRAKNALAKGIGGKHGAAAPSAPVLRDAADKYVTAWREVRRGLELLQCPGNEAECSEKQLSDQLRLMLRLLVAEVPNPRVKRCRAVTDLPAASDEAHVEVPPCHERLLDSEVVAHLCRYAKAGMPHLVGIARIVLHHIADIILLAGEQLVRQHRMVAEPLLSLLHHAQQRRESDPLMSHGQVQLLYALSWTLSGPGMSIHAMFFFADPSSPRKAAGRGGTGSPVAAPSSPRRTPGSTSFVLYDLAVQYLSASRRKEAVPASEADYGHLTNQMDRGHVVYPSDVAVEALSCLFALRGDLAVKHAETHAEHFAEVLCEEMRLLITDAAAEARRDGVAAHGGVCGRLALRARLLDVVAVHPAGKLRAAFPAAFRARIVPSLRNAITGSDAPAAEQTLVLTSVLASALRSPVLRGIVCGLVFEPPVRDASLRGCASPNADTAAAAFRLCVASLRGSPNGGYDAFVAPWLARRGAGGGGDAAAEPKEARTLPRGVESLEAAMNRLNDMVHPALRRSEFDDGGGVLNYARRDAQAVQVRLWVGAAQERGGRWRPPLPPPPAEVSETVAGETLVCVLVRLFGALLVQPLQLAVALADAVTALLLCDCAPLTNRLVGGADPPAPDDLPGLLAGIKQQVNAAHRRDPTDFAAKLRQSRSDLGLPTGTAGSGGGRAMIQQRDGGTGPSHGPARGTTRGAVTGTGTGKAAGGASDHIDLSDEERCFFSACCVLEEWRRDVSATLRVVADAKLVAAMQPAADNPRRRGRDAGGSVIRPSPSRGGSVLSGQPSTDSPATAALDQLMGRSMCNSITMSGLNKSMGARGASKVAAPAAAAAPADSAS